MKIINLRNYYPSYLSDFYVEVTDDIIQLLKQLNQKDHADYERRRIHRAYYSLDIEDGIEKDIVLLVLSPEAIYEQKLTHQELYAAVNSLPEKQAKRIYAHFFLNMSKTQIAQIEGVGESTIRESINRGLRNIKKFIKKSS